MGGSKTSLPHTRGMPQQQPRKEQQTKRPEKKNPARSRTSPSLSILFGLLRMIISAVGICASFSLWSIKQERVVTKPYTAALANGEGAKTERLSTVFVLGLAQTVIGTLVGLLMLLAEKLPALLRRRRGGAEGAAKTATATRKGSAATTKVAKTTTKNVRVSRRDIPRIFCMTALMGFASAFGSSLSYAAMRRLPYPVVLAAKMSKMVPVMLVGFFWYGTRYSWRNCAACAVITAGVTCFYVLNDMDHPHGEKPGRHGMISASWIGFVMLFFSLVTDGFMNSTQHVLLKTHGLSSNQLMVVLNLASGAWLLLVLIALEALHPMVAMFLETETTLVSLFPASPFAPLLSHADRNLRWFLRDVAPVQDLSRTWHFFQQYPEALYDVVMMSLLNAVGQVFIFSTISFFGMLTFLALTLLRKAGSVLLSVSIHGHNVAVGQWVALLVVLAGALWEGLMNVRQNASRSERHKANGKRSG